MSYTKNPEEISCNVLKIIYEKLNDKCRRGISLRVVKWNDNAPVLEKRELFRPKGNKGLWLNGSKCRGLTFDDIKKILLPENSDVFGLLNPMKDFFTPQAA